MEFYKMYFKRRPTKKYYIACEIAKRAYKHTIIKNISDEDDSENHEVIFTEQQIDDIRLMNYTIGNHNLSEGINGYDIYGVDVKYLEGLCKYKGNLTYLQDISKIPDLRTLYINPESRKIAHFLNWQCKLDLDKNIVEVARKIIEIFINNKKFTSEDDLAKYLRSTYMIPIQEEFRKYIDFINFVKEDELRKKIKDEIKIAYDKIYEELVVKNLVPVKWKNENELYSTIKKYFKDARMHYSPSWLAPQHYDVYIPSINIAFEYQGQQHFKAIDYFGGEEALKKRIELDKRKNIVSMNNNVSIIEWMFDEPINKVNLEEKLKIQGIKLP